MSKILSRSAAMAASLFLAGICAATAAVPAHKLISQKTAQPSGVAPITRSAHGMVSVKSAFLRSHKFTSKKQASHKFAGVGSDGKKK
jgi:hypothetical protein